MGENHFAPWTVALYGMVLLFAAISYTILTKTLIAHHGKDSTLAESIGSDTKGNISLIIYVVALLLSFRLPRLACALYAVVAIIWLIPDPRIEKKLINQSHSH
jgi:uncharacterized membrane protein